MLRFFKNKIATKTENSPVTAEPAPVTIPVAIPVTIPVAVPLFSIDHINYYTYLNGEEYGKSLANWVTRERQKKRKRRISVDSSDPSSSPKQNYGTSSQRTSTDSTFSETNSSLQSSLLKLTISERKNTYSDKAENKVDRNVRPAINETSINSKDIGKPSKKRSYEIIEKSNIVNVNLKNNINSPQKQQTKTSESLSAQYNSTNTKSVTFDSFESIEKRQKPSTSRQSETKNGSKSKKSVAYESLSDVSSLNDLDTIPDELFLPESYEKSSLYTERNIINSELRYALSKSIPVSSKGLYDGQYSDDFNPSFLFSRTPSPWRQRSASVDLAEFPPSPAPGTPLTKNILYWQKRSSSYENVALRSRTNENHLLNESETYEVNFGSASRVTYLKVPYGNGYSLKYEILEPYKKNTKTLSSEGQNYRKHDAFTQPSYAEEIHEQFSSIRCNLNKGTKRLSREKMNSMDDHERKIIIEFCHLLEKSKQLFNGLRELPQYGHKQWYLYFGRTFDIYTRLWKYQQQHRAILDSKYGMKRWQIGEIASKIGQLYYHFYLRTSETAYLNEAYSFYYAIRGRCYYTKANKEDKCELMVKKLRYYARFIVVCLLLKKMKLVKDLIKELDRQIIEYGNTYDPDDQVEWTVVVDEVKAFIHAEPVVAVIDHENYSVIISNRLTPLTTPAIERTPQMNLILQEILIVGSSSQQVKFSELTMDMFRMLQTLEREPTGDVQHNFEESPRARYTSTPNAHCQDANDPNVKIPNPHKYLLFKPSPSQILVYLASGCNDLPPNGVLLLYISADGHIPQPQKHAEDVGYDMGGLITTSKNDIYRDCSRDPKAPTSSKFKELQCLYPGDLNPFTRRPFFLIVDSDNSYAFQNIPRHFGQPMVILMSPLELPTSFHDRRQQGSLFTLFLHSPLSAFCYCCDISNISLVHWDRAQILIDNFVAEATAILVRSRIDLSYISFLGDDFLRLLIVRYVFCEVVLRTHRGFRARTHLARCVPALPDDLLEHPALVHAVMELASHLQVRSHFHDPTIASGPPTTKD